MTGCVCLGVSHLMCVLFYRGLCLHFFRNFVPKPLNSLIAKGKKVTLGVLTRRYLFRKTLQSALNSKSVTLVHVWHVSFYGWLVNPVALIVLTEVTRVHVCNGSYSLPGWFMGIKKALDLRAWLVAKLAILIAIS